MSHILIKINLQCIIKSALLFISAKEEFSRLIDVCEDITQSYSALLQDPESKGKDHDRHYCGL